MQILAATTRQNVGIDDVAQAFERVSGWRPDRQRMHPDQIRERRCPSPLEIDGAAVATVRLDDEVLEESQRWRAQQGIARHAGKKTRIAFGLARNQGLQLLDPLAFAPDAIEVEEDGTIEQRFRRRLLDPFAEIAFPLPQRLTPFGVGRHHPAGAAAVAAARQPVADEICQRTEIVVVLRRLKAVVEHQRVVLVGDDQLLLSGHRTEGQKTVGQRWRAELLFGEFEQALFEAASDHRHRTADHPRAGILADHAREAGMHVGDQSGKFIDTALTENAADNEQAVARLIAQQVGQGDHADRPLLLEDRQMVYVVAQHLQHRFEDELVVLHRNRVTRHDFADRRVVAETLRHQPDADIAIGDDAGHAWRAPRCRRSIDDQQGRYTLLAHPPGGVDCSRLAPEHHRRATNQDADRRRHQLIRILPA